MRKPKLIYYNDARHYLLYRFDPPLSRHRLQSPVDDILGTGVDTLAFGLASGATFLHDSKVAHKWGDSVVNHNQGIMWWRAAKNLQAAIVDGLDPLKVVIDRAHEKDVQVIASLRINDPGAPEGSNENRYMLNRLKLEHPEYMIGEEDPTNPAVSTCLDFAINEVRQERMAVIEEVCDRYGADGLEIDDYVRIFFKPSEIKKNTPLLTDFVRSVRELLDNIGNRRGQRMFLSARIHPREDANLSVGMDVRSWVEQQLVDAIVINSLGFDLNPEAQFNWITKLAQKNGVWVYPHLGRTVYDDQNHRPNIEMVRAAASNQIAAGADGLYLSSLLWPHGPDEYLVMRELGDPDIYARKNKLYFPSQKDPSTEPWPVKCHLPTVLKEGIPSKVPFTVSDDLDSARAEGELKRLTLRVRIVQTGMDDKLGFNLNGSTLKSERKNISTFYGGLVDYSASRSGRNVRISTYYWYQFDLPVDLIRRGINEVEVTMHYKLAERTEDRILQQIELLVEYEQAPTTVMGQM